MRPDGRQTGFVWDRLLQWAQYLVLSSGLRLTPPADLLAHARSDASRRVTPAPLAGIDAPASGGYTPAGSGWIAANPPGLQCGSRWAVGAPDVDDRCVREGRSGAAALAPEAGAEISHPAVADPAPAVMWGHTVTAAPTAGHGVSMPPAAGRVPAGAATRAGNGARIGRAGARQASPRHPPWGCTGAPHSASPPSWASWASWLSPFRL
mmetsp:Transcript_54207/g.123514  ORF Transcript_54207/g.123514 Transcript_54207/m.123514 type:complete len:208 (+) Transcript_54207:319-942(+)